MRVSTVTAVLSSLVLFACGGSAHNKEVKGPESDPWAGYTGKYAGPSSATPKEAKADTKKADKAEAKADKAEAKAEAKTDDAAHKSSAATIHGESVSSIGLDTFADA